MVYRSLVVPKHTRIRPREPPIITVIVDCLIGGEHLGPVNAFDLVIAHVADDVAGRLGFSKKSFCLLN
jgi:hypothetical protein